MSVHREGDWKAGRARSCELHMHCTSMQGNHDNLLKGNHQALSQWINKISWKHCQTFSNTSKVASTQQGSSLQNPKGRVKSKAIWKLDCVILWLYLELLENKCVKIIYLQCDISNTIFVILQQSNFQLFQAVCVIVAFLSWLLMRYTGVNVQVAVEASTTSSTQNQGDRNF